MSDTAPASQIRWDARSVFERLAREELERTDYAGTEESLRSAIAFVFTTTLAADDAHAFYGPLVRAARKRAATLGCDVLYLTPTTDGWIEQASIERSVELGARGLVVFSAADGNPDVLTARRDGLPSVFVEYDTAGVRCSNVGIENETAFEDIVLHLANLGRRRIATITGPLDWRDGAERLTAYRSVMERIGYEQRPEYVQVGDYLLESGYRGMKRLLDLPEPPDAVAAASDVQAVGAIVAIEEADLSCPRDIAVTGFDDADFAATMRPALTTVRQPLQELGVAAVDTLATMIRDPHASPPGVRLPSEVIVRESCGSASRSD